MPRGSWNEKLPADSYGDPCAVSKVCDGLAGATVRMRKITAGDRSAVAKKAASARWV